MGMMLRRHRGKKAKKKGTISPATKAVDQGAKASEKEEKKAAKKVSKDKSKIKPPMPK